MVSVPSQSSLKDAGGSGVKVGGLSGISQAVGARMLGPGVGTAAGGIVGASAMSGGARDRAAERAVERGVVELFARGGGGSGGSRGSM